MVRISPEAAGNAAPRTLHPLRTDVAIVVSGGQLIGARSTLLGVLHREHFTSSHGNPPVIARPIVGDGCAGPPSLHILSFQLWHARLSASQISASPTRRFSCERSANMPVVARDITSSLLRGFPVTAG